MQRRPPSSVDAPERYTVQRLTSLREIEAIAPQWAELGRLSSANPLSLAPVALAWLRHVNKGEPSVFVARDSEGRISGIAPMHTRRLGPVNVVRWIGHGMGAIGEFVTRPHAHGVEQALVDAMADAHTVPVYELVEVDRTSSTYQAITRSTRLHYSLNPHELVPVIDLEDAVSAEEFLARPGRRKLRQNLARMDRATAADDTWADAAIRVIESPADVAEAIPRLTAVHDAAERDRPRQHFLADGLRPFTLEVFEETARSGQLTILELTTGSRSGAFLVCLRAGDIAYAWLARFDPAAEAIAPGHQLLRGAVDWAAGAGISRIDLQVGADPYKMRWSTGAYETVAMTVSRSGTLLAAEMAVRGVNWISARRTVIDLG